MEFSISPNCCLYDMDKHFVRAVTSANPKSREEIPVSVLEAAGVPSVPEYNCCFAQLLNTDGLQVDYFVSHWWGHPFERTVLALSNFAEDHCKEVGKSSF